MAPLPFPPNSTLSHPHFQTYRLSPTPSQSDISTLPLPTRCKPGSRWGHDEYPVGVKEVRRAARRDGLYGIGEEMVGWMSEKSEIVIAALDESSSTLNGSFQTLSPLPTSSTAPTEPPSLLSLPPHHLLATSGNGALFIYHLPTPTSIPATVPLTDLNLPPFLLHAAALTSTPDRWEILLECTTRTQVISASARPKIEVEVEIVCLTLDLRNADGVVEGKGEVAVEIKWRGVKGDDFLASVMHVPAPSTDNGMEGYWVLSSTSGLTSPTPPPPSTSLASSSDPQLSSPARSRTTAQPPFAWSQTSTTVTLLLRLPATFSSQDIHCLIRSHTLSLLLYSRGGTIAPELRSWVSAAGEKGGREWWDEVEEDESMWTLRAAGKGEVGGGSGKILEIELTKKNDKVKWPQPFSPCLPLPHPLPASHSADPTADTEIPETLSASDLEFSKSRLDMYTAPSNDDDLDLPDFEGGIGRLGAEGGGLAGLLREEMEDEDGEFDPAFGDPGESEGISGLGGGGKTGTELVFAAVNGKGAVMSKSVAQVLSTPFDGSKGAQDGFILKSSVDGAVFLPPPPPPPSFIAESHQWQWQWKHASTSPALSFVISSKKDAQYIHHYPCPNPDEEGVSGVTTFIFETRQALGLGGNLYIYYPPPPTPAGPAATGGKFKKKGAEESKQAVVKFGVDEDVPGGLGGLVGVKMVRGSLVGLCEGGLVVLKGIW